MAGKPGSYNSLIAVSYEARAQGVSRNMRGKQAREACPDLQLVQVLPPPLCPLRVRVRVRGRCRRLQVALQPSANPVNTMQVPTAHGKSDMTLYREAGAEVVAVLTKNGCTTVEKASVDEVYLVRDPFRACCV